nr:MAG TPA: hypothetical protein [Caudoviricetes sp.]
MVKLLNAGDHLILKQDSMNVGFQWLRWVIWKKLAHLPFLELMVVKNTTMKVLSLVLVVTMKSASVM